MNMIVENPRLSAHHFWKFVIWSKNSAPRWAHITSFGLVRSSLCALTWAPKLVMCAHLKSCFFCFRRIPKNQKISHCCRNIKIIFNKKNIGFCTGVQLHFLNIVHNFQYNQTNLPYSEYQKILLKKYSSQFFGYSKYQTRFPNANSYTLKQF